MLCFANLRFILFHRISPLHVSKSRPFPGAAVRSCVHSFRQSRNLHNAPPGNRQCSTWSFHSCPLSAGSFSAPPIPADPARPCHRQARCKRQGYQSGGLPCFSSLPVCFALLFLLQLFTVGQRFAAASAMMLPAGRAVTVSGAVYTPAGAGILRHMFHHRFSSMAAPAQARPIPSMGTADCASRLPRQDSTTTATPIARVSALKIIEMIS